MKYPLGYRPALENCSGFSEYITEFGQQVWKRLILDSIGEMQRGATSFLGFYDSNIAAPGLEIPRNEPKGLTLPQGYRK